MVIAIYQNPEGIMKLREIIFKTLSSVNKISIKNGYNKYIKDHPIEKIFTFLLYHQYSGIDYGRSFTLQMKYLLPKEIKSLSQGELSKKLSYRLPVKLWKTIFKNLYQTAKGMNNKKNRKILNIIKIIDSSHFEATGKMDWAKHKTTKNGFKLHMVIDGDTVPKTFMLKNGRSSDKKSLKWAVNTGYIYIYDRGYNDYSMFSWIVEKNAHFVTRALSNIKYHEMKKNRIGAEQKAKGILADKIIQVIENRKIDNKVEFRMVTFEFIDSNGKLQKFSLLTDMRNIKSEEIADLYKQRWNIEVMFYWLKTFLKVKHWMSRSKNGVLIQLYSALIAYLLALIAKIGNIKNYKIMRDYVHDLSGILIRILAYKYYGNIKNNLTNSS